MTLKELRARALQLSPEDQLRLADELLANLHGRIDPKIEQAHIEEIRRREEAWNRGEMGSRSAAEVVRDLKAKWA